MAGQRPVVHLPMGAYQIDRTLVVPRGCDLHLVGDGASEIATRLEWTGADDGVLLRIQGPSKVTVRDLQIQSHSATAMLVETSDRRGDRIFADQLNVSGPTNQPHGRTAAVRVVGIKNAAIQFRALQGSGNGGTWVEVVGSQGGQNSKLNSHPFGGQRDSVAPVAVFTGATGTSARQYNVKQAGRLVVRGVYHERSSDSLNGLHLTDRGTLSIDATRFSYSTSRTAPTVAADSFHGVFTLATCMLMPVASDEPCRFELRGDGSRVSVLALNNQF